MLDQGCIYFEQKKYPAGRGYAYVAVSRFRTRAGCHLNGNLRRSDFLPVGEDKEDEQLERGYYSLNSSDSEHDGAENYGNGIFGENGNDSSGESEYDADEDMAKITAGLIMTACAMAHLPRPADSWRSAQVGDPGQVGNARRSTQESPGQPSRCDKRDQREAA